MIYTPDGRKVMLEFLDVARKLIVKIEAINRLDKGRLSIIMKGYFKLSGLSILAITKATKIDHGNLSRYLRGKHECLSILNALKVIEFLIKEVIKKDEANVKFSDLKTYKKCKARLS